MEYQKFLTFQATYKNKAMINVAGQWDPDEAAVYMHAIERIRPVIGTGTVMSAILDFLGLKKASRKPMLEHCHASENTTVRWSDVTMCVSVVSYHLRANGHRVVDVYTLHECVRLFDEIN